MVGLWYYDRSGATELVIMRVFYYGRMCFKSVKTLKSSTFLALQKASAVFKAKNVEFLGLYHIGPT